MALTSGGGVSVWRVGHAGDEPGLTLSERAGLMELGREDRELGMEDGFLGGAAAFFAKESG